MAEFVRAQIFGTTFEITSRYAETHGPPPAAAAVEYVRARKDVIY